MDFGEALDSMRNGRQLSRRGWNGRLNGKTMYLTLRDGSRYENTLEYIEMRTADGTRVPWVASHTDLLACDWETV